MRLIKPSDEDLKYVIEKLKEKTNLFDYYTDEGFMEDLKNGYHLVYETEHSWYFCKICKWATGLVTLTIDQCTRAGKEGGGTSHMHENLSVIEEHARIMGVDRILLDGRKGIQRVFPEYNVDKVTLWRDL